MSTVHARVKDAIGPYFNVIEKYQVLLKCQYDITLTPYGVK